ncbi:MAG: major capsid protein [Microviridae sp.]|nr:MAG: major capsid protein [Microviridae sp.]
MFRNKSVNIHSFSMVPKFDVPRSKFERQWTHKTTFDAGKLVPIMVDEVLPADTFSLHMTALARFATPIFPVMDNLVLDSFFFFVPNRLIWTNWEKFQGAQDNPGDSISFVIPQQVSPNGGYAVGSLQDYMGLPTVGQVTGGVNVTHNALPLRAYNLIYNTWYKSQDLQTNVVVDKGDGPDTVTNYTLLSRGKRHDYFTSCLPWPLKGGVNVTLPLGTSAPVKSDGTSFQIRGATGALTTLIANPGTAGGPVLINSPTTANNSFNWGAVGASTTGLFADLSTASAATVNQLRTSFQIQKLLERDARSGTRYVEMLQNRWGVRPQDSRFDRPEYLGGGSTPVNINPIAQTSGTGITGGTTPLGNLSAMGTVGAINHGFTASFPEHGYIIGIINIRAELSYQQGLRKMWSRSTRYDFYMPEFAALGEQAVLNKEIYVVGSATGGVGAADQDMQVFGYQERWGEYRYFPSYITGLFRSTSAGTIDGWHLAQKFTALPVLNSAFITDTPPVSRVVAVGAAANGQQFICDTLFKCDTTRAMPMYGVPGLIDHF